MTAIETEDGARWAESKIKSLTGGDKIAARFMRCDFFEFCPEFKLVIAGNHKPGLRSVDEAIRRRLHLVPFTVTIPPGERDPRLAEKLRAEFPGILAWAVRGCLDWQERGAEPPGRCAQRDRRLHGRRRCHRTMARGWLHQRRGSLDIWGCALPGLQGMV